MRLQVSQEFKSWIKALPPGGTFSVRMKTAAEVAVADKGKGEG